MSLTNDDDLGEFKNALQLSLDIKVVRVNSICLDSNLLVQIQIDQNDSKDERWQYFELLTEGKWDRENKINLYRFNPTSLPEITQFILITRLKKENMVKIAELHLEYRKFVEKILGASACSQSVYVKSLDEIRKIIFEVISRKNITLLNLAHQSGLTPVSLSNFKAGQDIRLSTFMKIAKVLNIKIQLSLDNA